MKTTFYKNWNTLKYDACTPAYFYISPSIHVSYDPNEITDFDGVYSKQITIGFEFLCIRLFVYLMWNNHVGLK